MFRESKIGGKKEEKGCVLFIASSVKFSTGPERN